MNFNSIEFIKKLKQKDSEALSLIINSYTEALFKGALKQGLAEDQAEEVVQETWSTFINSVENFQQKSHIRTYLFGILFNKTKEIWRNNKKYTEHYEEYDLEALFSEGGAFIQSPQAPDAWTHSRQIAEILKIEIDKLPENQKMAFLLKEVQGESTKEICNIMGISSTNLGVLIYRAKNNLRLQLEKKLSTEEDL